MDWKACPLFGLALVAGACASATAPVHVGRVDDTCGIEPAAQVVVEDGDIPLVISSTHAGTQHPQGCVDGSARSLATRVCTPSLDLACESGPCRSGGPDENARRLTYAIRDDLAVCLGKKPALAIADIERDLVDLNRDADDLGGSRCALEDPAARPYWEAYHRAVERLVAHAVDTGGDHALLLDVHTFTSLPKAPAPALILGTGRPVGTTVPHQRAEDASLPLLYGEHGVRARLLNTLGARTSLSSPGSLEPRTQLASAPFGSSSSASFASFAPFAPSTVGGALAASTGVRVLPEGPEASPEDLEGLYVGRYVVHRYARAVEGEAKTAGPIIDSMQIEISDGLRNDVEGTAGAIAAAICGVYGARLKEAP